MKRRIIDLIVTISISIKLSVIMLNVAFSYCYAECRYDECHYDERCYDECRYDECRYAECRYSECCSAKDWLLLELGFGLII